MSFYAGLVKAYNWTLREIDEQDLADTLDFIVVMDKVDNAPKYASIEDVLPM